jgi:hypothetical protein
MKRPQLDENGACPDCSGGWLCPRCQRETAAAWEKRQAAIRDAVRMARAAARDRIAARFELEGDEFETADQKAERMLAV